MRFEDRRDAGRRLAEAVGSMELHDPVVLALPRGGVPVAYEVGRSLAAPVDVLVARKVGVPTHPELGMGAIAEGGAQVIDQRTVSMLRVRPGEIDEVVRTEEVELARRVDLYRGERQLPSLEGRDVLLVDDGLATGVTMRAGVASVRSRRPGRVIVAVPVCARDSADDLGAEGVEVVCLHQPDEFVAVGRWYERFAQTTDAEVLELLRAAEVGRAASG